MTANEKKQLMAAACKVRMGAVSYTHLDVYKRQYNNKTECVRDRGLWRQRVPAG